MRRLTGHLKTYIVHCPIHIPALGGLNTYRPDRTSEDPVTTRRNEKEKHHMRNYNNAPQGGRAQNKDQHCLEKLHAENVIKRSEAL